MIRFFSYNQINLGPVTLYTWGLFLGLALIAGYSYVLKQSKKQNIGEKKIAWLSFWAFIGIIVGSRLAYVLQFRKYYFENPSEIFRVNAGGLMFYGGFIGALLFSWLYLRKSKLDFLKLADIFAPAVALAIFIGRIGCFLINDHQGSITNLPWAIRWMDGTLRHPVALYLSLNGLILFLVLSGLKHKMSRPGQVFFFFLLWYAISRFFLDFLRANDTLLADPHCWRLTISQWISIFLFLLTFLSFRRKKTG